MVFIIDEIQIKTHEGFQYAWEINYTVTSSSTLAGGTEKKKKKKKITPNATGCCCGVEIESTHHPLKLNSHLLPRGCLH